MKKISLFIALIICILLIVFVKAVAKSKITNITTWYWDTKNITKSGIIDNIIVYSKKNKINEINVQIQTNIDYKYYESLINKANEVNIKINALTGSPDAIYFSENTHLEEFFDFVEYYNKSYPNSKFNGIHLDVEPYLLKDWNIDREDIILNYQDYIIYSKSKAQDLNMQLDLDLPFWFDEILYNNKYGSGNVTEWVIKNVDKTTIMAYRNSAKDIIKVSKDEVSMAREYNKNITVAVETIKQKETITSFYEKSNNYMIKELNTVYDYYDNNISIAIHGMDENMK